MTAAEIRNVLDHNLTARLDGTLEYDDLKSLLLSEIAAQLAEMNERAEPSFHRELAAELSSVVKLLIAAGDALAEELAKITTENEGTTYFPAARSVIEKWKAVRG